MTSDYNEFQPYELEQEGYELVTFIPRKNDDNSDSLEARLIFQQLNFSFRKRFDIKILRVICGYIKEGSDVGYLQSYEYAKNYGNHFAIYVRPKDPAALERNIQRYQFQEAYNELLDAEDMSDAERWDCYDKGDFYESDDYDDFIIDDYEFWDEETRKDFEKKQKISLQKFIYSHFSRKLKVI